jgi:hypothetical protein
LRGHWWRVIKRKETRTTAKMTPKFREDKIENGCIRNFDVALLNMIFLGNLQKIKMDSNPKPSGKTFGAPIATNAGSEADYCVVPGAVPGVAASILLSCCRYSNR